MAQNKLKLADVASSTGTGDFVFATAPTFQTSINGAFFTASETLITDGSKNVISAAVATYPSLTELTYLKGVTSAIQTQLNAKQATITFGTGVQTALGVNIGSAGAPVLFNGALGTPSSGTVTNLTGTASININGTVGATTPTTGVFTTLVAGSTTSLLLGTAGSAVGNIGFRNATSGTITLAPVTGALGTVTLTLPAITDTLAALTATQTFTNKTLQGAAITGALTGTGAYIPVSLLNSGTSASSSTFWRGDGTWAAPAGGGSFSYKTGGTASASDLNITGLNLDTDTKYMIWVQWYAGSMGSGDDITVTLNSDTTASYGYAWNGYGRKSDTNGVYQGAAEDASAWKICDDYARGILILYLTQETLDSSNEFKVVNWNATLRAPTGTGQAAEVTATNGGGGFYMPANCTSVQINMTGASSVNWEYRVYKLSNS